MTTESGEPKFDRDVHCLLGLPMDAVSMNEAVQRLRHAAFTGQRCFISTPNLNFVMAARGDSGFRDSVLRSDLSLADGMPLVWVAKLLGLPIRERVSGAGLYEHLLQHPGPPVTVYFFGGPQGAAEAACRQLNQRGGGLNCVGFDSPGFGSLEDMSTPEHIDRINRSGAMFVIVSLGAKKGQRWIEMNRDRLQAPVLCHLGAVVNFAAGTVKRAPGWVQSVGAEWLWRILQEPGLWRRYWADGLAFLKVLAGEVLPLWAQRLNESRNRSLAAPALDAAPMAGGTRVALSGSWEAGDLHALRAAIAAALRSGGSIAVDLAQTSRIGSATIGELMLARAACGETRVFEVRGAGRQVARTFVRSGASFLLDASGDPSTPGARPSREAP